MNNKQYRPRISEIELKMILTDMNSCSYHYSDKNKESHTELYNRLLNLIPRRLKLKEEVLRKIEKMNIYQEHESCIAIDKKEFNKLKQEE